MAYSRGGRFVNNLNSYLTAGRSAPTKYLPRGGKVLMHPPASSGQKPMFPEGNAS
uniref:Uncharacterized protein n=1 Tax=Magallana gigas TaxID=29159 RepID=K1PR41_MAGGI